MPNNSQRDMTLPQCMMRPRRGGDRRVDLRRERFPPWIVLARAAQETRALAADCNSRWFDRLIGNDSSSFDFFARAISARREAFLKV